jgi:hypothetical protein
LIQQRVGHDYCQGAEEGVGALANGGFGVLELLQAGGHHGAVVPFHVVAEALQEVGEVVEAFELDFQGLFLLHAAEETGAKAGSHGLREGREGGREESERHAREKKEGGREGGREGETTYLPHRVRHIRNQGLEPDGVDVTQLGLALQDEAAELVADLRHLRLVH